MINYDINYIESSLKSGKSYRELGREYGVTDSAIRKLIKKNNINISKRRKINLNENFNKGKIVKKRLTNEEREERLKISKEKDKARRHNLILKEKYSSLNIPEINPGCCPICGTYHCNNSFCKSHNFQGIVGLVKLGLDSTKIGTFEIFNEYNKIKNILYDLYWIQGLSLLDLRDKFNIGTEHFPTNILDFLGIERRTFSESSVNAIKLGKISLPINLNTFLGKTTKQGRYITWEGKEIYLRSSYEEEYAKELDSLKIKYEVESIRISYFNKVKDREAIAVPDFYLPETNTIVEIKSDFTLDIEEMICKFDRYKELGYSVKLLLEKEEVDLYNIENIISESRLNRIKNKNIRKYHD